jgi:exosome complex component RRP42
MMNKHIRIHALNLLSKGLRSDGRKPDEFRKPLKIELGVSGSAHGSARVTIGNTVVMAGVMMELGTPYPDNPDEGSLMIGAELIPMSNPDFEQGPPGIQAVELGRVVDRAIRESHAVDMTKLCIKPKEKVWIISIDIVSINDDGNLFDASALAAMAALKDTRLPELDADWHIVPHTHTDKKLHILEDVVEITIYKIGDHFIVDPTTDEEQIYDARLTIGIKENNELCALQKGGEFGLSADDIDHMISIALKHAPMLRKALKVK